MGRNFDVDYRFFSGCISDIRFGLLLFYNWFNILVNGGDNST